MATNTNGSTIGALLLAVLLSACAVQEPVPAPVMAQAAAHSLVGTEWVAFSIDGVDEVLSPKPRLRWLSLEQVSGNGGCNAFKAQVTGGAADSLRLGPLLASGKPCLTMPGDQEDRFFKALEQTRKTARYLGQLLLMDESGNVLARFLRAE